MHPARADLSLANVLYALGDPIRLKVVTELAATEEGDSCQHIVAGMNVAKATQSHHFKVLREAGVLRMEPQGRRLLVRLRRDDLEARFPGLLDAILHSCQKNPEILPLTNEKAPV